MATNPKLRPITPEELLESASVFGGLVAHMMDEQVEVEPEMRREMEAEANELQAMFLKEAGGKRNGVVVIAAIFIVHKIVNQYRVEAANGGSTLIQ